MTVKWWVQRREERPSRCFDSNSAVRLPGVRHAITLVLAATALACLTLQGCTPHDPIANTKSGGARTATVSEAEPETFCAVSLVGLSDAAQGCMQTDTCSDPVRQLGGIRQLLGYVVDRTNKDIILIGK